MKLPSPSHRVTGPISETQLEPLIHLLILRCRKLNFALHGPRAILKTHSGARQCLDSSCSVPVNRIYNYILYIQCHACTPPVSLSLSLSLSLSAAENRQSCRLGLCILSFLSCLVTVLRSSVAASQHWPPQLRTPWF